MVGGASIGKAARRGMLALACVAVGALAGPGLGAGTALGDAWSTAPTPPVTQGPLNGLFGVSCATATRCVAVGAFGQDLAHPSPLAEIWDGSGWKLATASGPLPVFEPTAASCPAVSMCLAVGGGGSDLAVTTPAAQRWDPHGWTALNAPGALTSSTFNGVSCPAADDCLAVGYSQDDQGRFHPLIEHWNGTQWAVQSAPDVAWDELTSVSCASTTSCLAVGSGLVAGHQVALAEVLASGRWTRAAPATSGNVDELSAVDCPAVDVCEAVGSTVDGAGQMHALALRWDGAGWAVQPAPDPPGGGGLLSISCPTVNSCVAVGHGAGTGTGAVAVAERFDGFTWSLDSVLATTSATPVLNGVACPNAATCFAVGYGQSGSGANALIMHGLLTPSSLDRKRKPGHRRSPGTVAAARAAAAVRRASALLARRS